eukprot:GHVT01104887.1.p1 GENE.GHVT01104887.1~~GHVT01104887.1.p1  ORF type:complete len:365 (+),score=55.89 GHVT01104887.1:1065-2159(+)
MTLSADTAQWIVWVTCLLFGMLAITSHLIRSKGRLFFIDETYFSARRSQRWPSLALSIYSTCMGNWSLYAPADVGAAWSWAGVLGYALACSVPLWVFAGLAVRVKKTSLSNSIFCGADFILVRFGRAVHLLTVALSVFLMFSMLAAELSGIGTSICTLTNTHTELFRLSIVLPVALITLLYTTIAGLPASILTDKLQGALVAALLILLISSCAAFANFSAQQWAQASYWSSQGAVGGSMILFSMLPVVLFDQGMWQRSIAAASVNDVWLSFLVGGLLCFVSIFSLGTLGILARAMFPSYQGYNIIFLLIAQLSTGWQVVGAILAVTLAASSLDTYQNAISSIVGFDLQVKTTQRRSHRLEKNLN